MKKNIWFPLFLFGDYRLAPTLSNIYYLFIEIKFSYSYLKLKRSSLLFV